jgi:hypothetical protein
VVENGLICGLGTRFVATMRATGEYDTYDQYINSSREFKPTGELFVGLRQKGE